MFIARAWFICKLASDLLDVLEDTMPPARSLSDICVWKTCQGLARPPRLTQTFKQTPHFTFCPPHELLIHSLKCPIFTKEWHNRTLLCSTVWRKRWEEEVLLRSKAIWKKRSSDYGCWAKALKISVCHWPCYNVGAQSMMWHIVDDTRAATLTRLFEFSGKRFPFRGRIWWK